LWWPQIFVVATDFCGGHRFLLWPQIFVVQHFFVVLATSRHNINIYLMPLAAPLPPSQLTVIHHIVAITEHEILRHHLADD
jgi:hypothetical protein